LIESPQNYNKVPIKPRVPSANSKFIGEIVRASSIPDGDGITLEDGRRVRYIGIDAPEIYTWQGRSEPYAEEAREYNRNLIKDKPLRLDADKKNCDRYGRILRYVYAGDKLVNAEMIRVGLARAMSIAPNLTKAAEFKELEAIARQNKLKIWKEMT
jgi:micrococcal nuclease